MDRTFHHAIYYNPQGNIMGSVNDGVAWAYIGQSECVATSPTHRSLDLQHYLCIVIMVFLNTWALLGIPRGLTSKSGLTKWRRMGIVGLPTVRMIRLKPLVESSVCAAYCGSPAELLNATLFQSSGTILGTHTPIGTRRTTTASTRATSTKRACPRLSVALEHPVTSCCQTHIEYCQS